MPLDGLPKGARRGEIHKHVCSECGKEFTSKRRGSHLCSQRCRNTSSHRSLALEKRYKDALEIFEKLATHPSGKELLPKLHGWMHDNKVSVYQEQYIPWDWHLED